MISAGSLSPFKSMESWLKFTSMEGATSPEFRLAPAAFLARVASRANTSTEYWAFLRDNTPFSIFFRPYFFPPSTITTFYYPM